MYRQLQLSEVGRGVPSSRIGMGPIGWCCTTFPFGPRPGARSGVRIAATLTDQVSTYSRSMAALVLASGRDMA